MKIYPSLALFQFFHNVLAIPVGNTTSDSTQKYPQDVHCDAQYIDDANAAAITRWQAAEADWAYDTAAGLWAFNNVTIDPTTLSFTEYISDYFDSKDLMICRNMGDGPCQDTVTCSDVNQPAG